jgi:hypothetical protein
MILVPELDPEPKHYYGYGSAKKFSGSGSTTLLFLTQ